MDHITATIWEKHSLENLENVSTFARKLGGFGDTTGQFLINWTNMQVNFCKGHDVKIQEQVL
jgi:hypothetical protein